AESVYTPVLRTKPANPDRCDMSLKRMARRSATTPFATSEAMIQPIARIMINPIIFGIAARNRASAWVIEVKIASPQSRTGTGTMAAFLRGGYWREENNRG